MIRIFRKQILCLNYLYFLSNRMEYNQQSTFFVLELNGIPISSKAKGKYFAYLYFIQIEKKQEIFI